ncbi:vascular cell adhesion protein 1-like [Pseudophryne corroboree]|uniref:vascular cell adhesion protein 1-like n=1 Tax=Pseudophryne corroboree TaxID=495146 RepID=UPI0030815CD2
MRVEVTIRAQPSRCYRPVESHTAAVTMVWTIKHLCLLLQMWGIFHIGKSECEVQSLSDMVFVPFGEVALLNCSYTCGPVTWKSRLRKINTYTGPNWLSTEVLVDDWETSEAVCIDLSNSENFTQSKVLVKAYVPPSNVTIDLNEELEEGKFHLLQCRVYDVAPVEHLLVSVVRGGKEIQRSTFKEDLRQGKHTVMVRYDVMVSRRDNLQDFYCLATLQLGTGLEQVVQSPSVTIRTYGPPSVPSITVAPSSTIKSGDSFTLTCQADGSPDPIYHWNVPPGAVMTYSQKNSTVKCSRADSGHNGTYQCEARNTHGRTRSHQVMRITNGETCTSLAAILFFTAILVPTLCI